MNGYDGPSLRAFREGNKISLRKVARLAGLTHGHLSKVERGEPGRPVTSTVLHAYELATGKPLSTIDRHHLEDPWQPGQLSDTQRRRLNAGIAAIAVGGHLPDRIETILENTGRLIPPEVVDETDVAQVERITRACAQSDLAHGGAVSDEMTRTLLKWAIGLLAADMTDTTRQALNAAIAALAHRAGWSAFDAHHHQISRSLLTIGLYAAARADDPDLRAHILADLGAGHNYLGHPDACLQIVRLAEVDERISPHIQMVVAGVKARAYALRGYTTACQHAIQVADQAHTRTQEQPEQDGDWRASVATAGRLYAITGHALATLTRRTGDDEIRHRALQRLTWAMVEFDQATCRRSIALVAAQLATLYAEAGDVENGRRWAVHAEQFATGIRSARLAAHLAAMRAALTATDTPATDADLPASEFDEPVTGVPAADQPAADVEPAPAGAGVS